MSKGSNRRPTDSDNSKGEVWKCEKHNCELTPSRECLECSMEAINGEQYVPIDRMPEPSQLDRIEAKLDQLLNQRQGTNADAWTNTPALHGWRHY
jgi:hypothetical protein